MGFKAQVLSLHGSEDISHTSQTDVTDVGNTKGGGSSCEILRYTESQRMSKGVVYRRRQALLFALSMRV